MYCPDLDLHLNVTVMHSVDDFAPVDSVVDPSGQLSQAVSDVALVILSLYLPVSQSEQEIRAWPGSTWYDPWPHSCALVMPVLGQV